MQIRVDKVNNVAFVAVDGEISADHISQLQDVFAQIIKEGENKVVMDFEKVSFIDSSGLSVLIEMIRQLRRVNGKLALCHVNKAIQEIFEITKVHKLIAIHENRQMAVRDI